jgi:hypothetical protein
MRESDRVDKRNDRWTALLIDAAINASASHGMAGATDELMRHGLTLKIVQRVLLMPGERRACLAWDEGPRRSGIHASFDPKRREDKWLAAAIDAALLIGCLATLRQAEHLLRLHSVQADTIERVLYKGAHLRRVLNAGM